MQQGVPSRTAYRVALRRATHQVWDRPLVFDDPLALRMLGLAGADVKAIGASGLRAPSRASSMSPRAFVVARSRFAEDVLHDAVPQDQITQYILLGAGLDTFAYRNPYVFLRVFEVDHPATQAWKRELLRSRAIVPPASMRHVSVDFEADSLKHSLAGAGFDQNRPAVFAWLGVVPYLTKEGFASTLSFLSGVAARSRLVLDYRLPRRALPPIEQLEFDSLAARVAAAGEPFRLSFTPKALHDQLSARGWAVTEDLHRDSINARYFAGRTDQLRCAGSGARLLHAILRR